MDPSIVKLLEEDDDDEGKSMHSDVDVDTLQADLARLIQEGESHYWSQQFATGNNGCIGDADTNLRRQDVFEITQMRAQQLSLLSNQNQENKSHLQNNPPQDHRGTGKLWENPCHVPQSGELKSRSNPIGNELERPQPQYMKLQKMSSQQVHGVEQPVDSVDHGPTQAQICDFHQALIDCNQHDKDREMHYLSMYDKLKRKETTTDDFVQHLKDRMGDQKTETIISKMHQIQLGNTEIKVPGSPNNDRMPSASEISAQEPDARRVHVNQLPSTTSGTLSSSGTVQGLNKHLQKHIQLPSTSFHKDTNSGGFNTYPGTDVTSPGSSSRAKLPDFQTWLNMGSPSVRGPTNSTINMKTDPKFERPNSVNGPSRVQGGPISHFPNNSYLPLHSDPSQGSVTKYQTVGPSSSVPVVHVKQKSIHQSFGHAQKPLSLVQQGVTNVPLKQHNALPSRSNDDLEKQSSKMVLSTSTTSASSVHPSMTTQPDSSTMVNLPAASGTYPTGAKVGTTSKMPSVGRKKPLEDLGSSLPPSRKKQKLCETSSDQNIEKINDVTAVSGINLREEENQLLFSGCKKSGRVSKASQRVVHEEEERTILQKLPLQRMLTEITAKSGIKHIDHGVERCLSLCVEERMRGLLSNIIRMSNQRIDAEKCRNRTFVTSDIRKQINEMNQKVKEEWEKKHAGEEKVKNEENVTGKEDKRSEQLKVKKDADERRAKAANVAVHAAVGGDATFLKWKLMAEARQKLSSGPGKNSKKLSRETGGTNVGKNHGLSKVVRSISGKDVIAVVAKEPQMRRSTLLYRLYNRICSDI